jgi:DNA N-6-adenine-methyltransferase (Dam)
MTLGSHQRCVGQSQDHITPKWILDRLGEFDMDPAAADPRPWSCANHNITAAMDGLSRLWCGRIWLNPPFDRYQVGRWIQRLAEHGRGTALLHARTEAAWFEPVWESASGILFLATRLKFCRADGSEQPFNSGAPAVLVAFGEDDLTRIRASGIAGTLVTDWETAPAREVIAA